MDGMLGMDKDSVMTSSVTSSNGIMTSPSNSIMSGGLQNPSQASQGMSKIYVNWVIQKPAYKLLPSSPKEVHMTTTLIFWGP